MERIEVNQSGLESIRIILADCMDVNPEDVRDAMVRYYAGHAEEQFAIGNGASFEVNARTATSGRPEVFWLDRGDYDIIEESDDDR